MQAYFVLPDEEALPAKKSRILKVHFAGCNFRCPSCNTPEILAFKEEFLYDLKMMKRRIKEHAPYIDGVLFTGGEPTLQRQALIELGNLCRKLHLQIAIDTNGSKPNVIRTLIELRLIDSLILDVKAPADDEVFQQATKSKTFFLITKQIIDDLKETIELVKVHQDEIDVELRTLIVPGIVYRKEDILGIGKMLDGMNCRWSLVQFSSHNGGILSKNLVNIKPPSERFLLKLQEAIVKEFPGLRVSIIISEESDD